MEIVLTLTKAEAQTLMDVVGKHCIGAENTGRRHTDALYDALKSVGVFCRMGKGSPRIDGMLDFGPFGEDE